MDHGIRATPNGLLNTESKLKATPPPTLENSTLLLVNGKPTTPVLSPTTSMTTGRSLLLALLPGAKPGANLTTGKPSTTKRLKKSFLSVSKLNQDSSHPILAKLIIPHNRCNSTSMTPICQDRVPSVNATETPLSSKTYQLELTNSEPLTSLDLDLAI